MTIQVYLDFLKKQIFCAFFYTFFCFVLQNIIFFFTTKEVKGIFVFDKKFVKLQFILIFMKNHNIDKIGKIIIRI